MFYHRQLHTYQFSNFLAIFFLSNAFKDLIFHKIPVSFDKCIFLQNILGIDDHQNLKVTDSLQEQQVRHFSEYSLIKYCKCINKQRKFLLFFINLLLFNWDFSHFGLFWSFLCALLLIFPALYSVFPNWVPGFAHDFFEKNNNNNIINTGISYARKKFKWRRRKHIPLPTAEKLLVLLA